MSGLRVVWLIARMLLAMPVRGLGWALFLVGLAGTGSARLVGRVANWIEGVS